MDSFFNGFADELVKLGATPLASSSSRPGEIKMLKQTSPGREATQRPSNAYGATSKALQATPPQAIKTWGTKKEDTWQPTPRYKPKATAKPIEPPKKKSGGKSHPKNTATGRLRMPGEGGGAFLARSIKEKADWAGAQKQKRFGDEIQKSMDTSGISRHEALSRSPGTPEYEARAKRDAAKYHVSESKGFKAPKSSPTTQTNDEIGGAAWGGA